MFPSTLQRFAQANDTAAATTKKLQKQAILADYFREIGTDDDLRLAVRYVGGRAFSAIDDRVLNVGGALMRDAILALHPIPMEELRSLIVRSGEVGEALSTLWTGVARSTPSPVELTLAAIDQSFAEIARLSRRENKRQALVDLLRLATSPREAAYLAKIIFGDLRTGVQEGVLQAGIASAFAVPLPDIQRCQLLVGDLGDVAVLARAGQMKSAVFRLFHPIQSMLATPKETPADAADAIAGRTYFADDKLDGIRAQIHKSGDASAARVAIYTRTLDRIDESFPDVVNQVRQLPGELLLDGEIVPYEEGQVLPFSRLQKRLGRKRPTAAMLRENPCSFVAFDLLFQDGVLRMDEPLRDRRSALEMLCRDRLPTTTPVPVASEAEIVAVFAAARDRRNEGIVLKDAASVYSPGRRGQMWFKLKTHLPTLDCVVTAAETGHGKRKNSLSDYTFAVWTDDPSSEGARLVNIGKAFSGVTDEEIERLTTLFTEITLTQDGRLRGVKPQVVLEIACDQIQRSERHASGYALRFPRIKRIRWDKRPEDADRLERAAEIYESSPNFAKSSRESAAAQVPEPTLFDA